MNQTSSQKLKKAKIERQINEDNNDVTLSSFYKNRFSRKSIKSLIMRIIAQEFSHKTK